MSRSALRSRLSAPCDSFPAKPQTAAWATWSLRPCDDGEKRRVHDALEVLNPADAAFEELNQEGDEQADEKAQHNRARDDNPKVRKHRRFGGDRRAERRKAGLSRRRLLPKLCRLLRRLDELVAPQVHLILKL